MSKEMNPSKDHTVAFAIISGVVTVLVSMVVAWVGWVSSVHLAEQQLSLARTERLVSVMRGRLEFEQDIFGRYLSTLERVKTSITKQQNINTAAVDDLDQLQALIYLNAGPYTIAAVQRMYGQLFFFQKSHLAGDVSSDTHNRFVAARQDVLDEMKKELRRREAAAAGVSAATWTDKMSEYSGLTLKTEDEND